MSDVQQEALETLYRIDERTSTLLKDLDELKNTVYEHYVTQAEFAPIKKIIYGLVGLTITGVFTAILALVIQKHPTG